ncbi:hypothetical protein B0H94_107214 [Salsuginibacillus halophilus]|uniref:SbsA Ig-like domain-containing protein n=1 Tax=Salsuginibacillus halophilus TaxID=517424 RepID=A0A2P8HG67_9BACI|nr:hypothetical protein [Salsuginibacillus halophilus]PSL45209.1 hypothetical protein B0H94_107214 [Salsuginibacillus halophilus]
MKALTTVFMSIWLLYSGASTLQAQADESSYQFNHPGVKAQWDETHLSVEWGPFEQFGHQVQIQDAYYQDEAWHVFYKLTYPDTSSLPLAIETHPRDAIKVVQETGHHGNDIHLYEVRGDNSYMEYQQPAAVAEDKTFTLAFEQMPAQEALQNEGVYVLDSSGEAVDTIIVLNDDQEVKVLPPEDGYERDEFYTLYVQDMMNEHTGIHGFKQSFQAVDHDEDDHTPMNLMAPEQETEGLPIIAKNHATSQSSKPEASFVFEEPLHVMTEQPAFEHWRTANSSEPAPLHVRHALDPETF